MDLATYHNAPISEHEVPGSKPAPGLCPTCGRLSGSMRIGVQTWHFCDPCRTAWHTSSSRTLDGSTVAAWAENRTKLDGFKIVSPKSCTLVQLTHETMIARGRMKRG